MGNPRSRHARKQPLKKEEGSNMKRPEIEFKDENAREVAHFLFIKRGGLSKLIEKDLGIQFDRSNLSRVDEIQRVSFRADAAGEKMARQLFQHLCTERETGAQITKGMINHFIEGVKKAERHAQQFDCKAGAPANNGSKMIGPYKPTPRQEELITSLETNAATFAIGPAGVGKTITIADAFLKALGSGRVKRGVITRSAAKTNKRQEDIGFEPGTKEQKMETMLLPIYEAIDELTGHRGTAAKMLKNGTIEVAPIATMRGRNLRDAFVICIEGQNLTKDTAKMLLTRSARGSILAIDGDPDQNDIEDGATSGLKWWADALKDSPPGMVGIIEFDETDVKRSPLTRFVLERGKLKEQREASGAEEGGGLKQPMGKIAKFSDFKRR
jgi:phosphate starvation-inducible PhoH-like protein